MTPLILDAQSKGTIGGAWLNRSNQMTDINVGGYTVNVELRQNRRQPDAMADIGYAIVIAAGQDEFSWPATEFKSHFSHDSWTAHRRRDGSGAAL